MSPSKRTQIEQENAKWPVKLTEVPRGEWPAVIPDKLVAAWRSRHFFVQKYEERDGITRLTICTTHPGSAVGETVDGIGWDEINQIKQELGFGDSYAIEVYPRDLDLVNVANMRHIWILPAPLNVGWFR